MTYRLTWEAIDYLLYNLAYLRKEVELIPFKQGGIPRIPPRGTRRASQVELVAIERAELSTVLDAVERGWRSLTPELREVAVAKYRRHLTNKEIAKRCALSGSGVDRRLVSIRACVAGYLALVPDVILTRFWTKIGANFEELVTRR